MHLLLLVRIRAFLYVRVARTFMPVSLCLFSFRCSLRFR